MTQLRSACTVIGHMFQKELDTYVKKNMAETLAQFIRNWKGHLVGKTSPRASIFSVDMFWSFGNIGF